MNMHKCNQFYVYTSIIYANLVNLAEKHFAYSMSKSEHPMSRLPGRQPMAVVHHEYVDASRPAL